MELVAATPYGGTAVGSSVRRLREAGQVVPEDARTPDGRARRYLWRLADPPG